MAAPQGVVLGDLSTPCEMFGHARDARGRALYDVRICSVAPQVASTHAALMPPYRLASLARADTVIVPGVADLDATFSTPLLKAIGRAAERGARVASICTGAFLLAAAGVLDGRRATTHWLTAAELQRRHPAIDVDPNVLFVDNGNTLTSAGACAGIDLCLYMVRKDFGADVAAMVARAAVTPLERAGGQAQFIVHEPPACDGVSIAPLLAWIDRHLTRDLTLPAIAKRAAMSTRTLSRRFREQTGATPAQWVTVARTRRAQRLLETTDLAVERIASEVGFGSSAVLRGHFHKIVGTSPHAYRRTWKPARRGPKSRR